MEERVSAVLRFQAVTVRLKVVRERFRASLLVSGHLRTVFGSPCFLLHQPSLCLLHMAFIVCEATESPVKTYEFVFLRLQDWLK